MQSETQPVAYLYEREDGSRDLLFDCNSDYARRLLEIGATETPLYATRTPTPPADSAGPPYASGNWDIQGYKSPAEEIDDMANVGRSLIEHIASVVSSDGPFKGWTPADDPAEIVSDMANWIADMSRPSDWFAGDVDADGNELVTVPAHHIAAQDAEIARLHVLLRDAVNDAVSTLAAIRAASAGDEWHLSSQHFHDLCGETIARLNALNPETGHD